MSRYHEGGLINGMITATIHPEECVLAPVDINAPHDLRCIRRDHSHLTIPREVVADSEGWRVTQSTFATSDRDLADAVRAELDAVDPVQGPLCRHEGESVSIRAVCEVFDRRVCQRCGDTFEVSP